TQPAMLLAGVCAWRAWQALGGPPPHLVAGHSLGEYAALVAAGVFRPSDALRLVRLRAIAMQEAVPEGSGAMAAILGLEDAAVIESCAIVSAQSGQLVEAVNFNAPSQVVIALMDQAAERFAKRLVCIPKQAIDLGLLHPDIKHAHRLGTLPGKNKCNAHSRLQLMESMLQGFCSTSSLPSQ
ncbi:MAG: ACP S-malonyltransferase, partial [Betaproteobacteria bacterium]|nr:ACP S-malonyltransferase [Betaproteobacteria bacterium]